MSEPLKSFLAILLVTLIGGGAFLTSVLEPRIGEGIKTVAVVFTCFMVCMIDTRIEKFLKGKGKG